MSEFTNDKKWRKKERWAELVQKGGDESTTTVYSQYVTQFLPRTPKNERKKIATCFANTEMLESPHFFPFFFLKTKK